MPAGQQRDRQMAFVGRFLLWLSRSDRLGFVMLRVAVAVVFLWFGALDFTPGAAESITPFVASNPVFSHIYRHPEQYRAHLTREGEQVPAQSAWQRDNGTSAFADFLGGVNIAIGVLMLAGLVSSPLGGIGAALAFLTSLVTLSFLVTAPEAWVPAPGDWRSGFPYLSTAGRMILKDSVLLAGAFALMVQSAKALRH
jgi:uncharacterized membrane protein YkgB